MYINNTENNNNENNTEQSQLGEFSDQVFSIPIMG